MTINSISNNPTFTGSVILKNKISSQQNYLFNLHRPALEEKIKDMPFDLFVEQSKSKKTITLSTNVKDANLYFVRKNKQNFEEVADLAIADAQKRSEAYKKAIKVNEMFNYQKSALINIVTGDFKEARKSEKQLAKSAVEDFETYTAIPNIKFTNVPFGLGKRVIGQSIKYRLYKAFSSKTPEEKQFMKMKKEYLNTLKSQNKQIKTVEIKYPWFYY